MHTDVIPSWTPRRSQCPLRTNICRCGRFRTSTILEVPERLRIKGVAAERVVVNRDIGGGLGCAETTANGRRDKTNQHRLSLHSGLVCRIASQAVCFDQGQCMRLAQKNAGTESEGDGRLVLEDGHGLPIRHCAATLLASHHGHRCLSSSVAP